MFKTPKFNNVLVIHWETSIVIFIQVSSVKKRTEKAHRYIYYVVTVKKQKLKKRKLKKYLYI